MKQQDDYVMEFDRKWIVYLEGYKAFFMATKGGGKCFGKAVNFEEEYGFDAHCLMTASLIIQQNLIYGKHLNAVIV